MAAAFGAPVAGVLLVLEEGASFWDTQMVIHTFFCGMCAKLFFFIFLQVFKYSISLSFLQHVSLLIFSSSLIQNKNNFICLGKKYRALYLRIGER